MSGIFTPRGGIRSIGRRKNEAASGTHIHDGVTSRRLTRAVLKNILNFTDLLDVYHVQGTWTTNATGDITIPHPFSTVPTQAFFQPTGGTFKGFYNALDASFTTSNVIFRCWDTGNTIRGAGVNLPGYVLVFA